MELTEFNAITADIMNNLGDQGLVSNKLAELTQGFTDEVSARSSADEKVTSLTAANDKLKQDNMALFLRATTPITDPSKPNPNMPNQDDAADPIDKLFADGGINWTKE